MIENWVNWEVWEGVLSARVVAGWWVCNRLVGACVMHACGTLTRLARARGPAIMDPVRPFTLVEAARRAPREGVGPNVPAGRARRGGAGGAAWPPARIGQAGRRGNRAVDLDRTLDEAQVTVTMTRLEQCGISFFRPSRSAS